MRVGTIAIRAELPPQGIHITDKQIQEALWHYYYDIEKSVGYLVSTYISGPKAQKKAKAQDVKKTQGRFCSFFSLISMVLHSHASGGAEDVFAATGFEDRIGRA
jgi:hypothetical protein